MRWRTFWLFLASIGLLDALALGAWTVVGWGLRGSSHDGTPASEIAAGESLIYAVLATMVLAHLGLGAWGVFKQRSDAWIASIASVVLVPITLPVGLLIVGGILRLVLP